MSPARITRLLVIRHGETLWNREGRIQGHINIPLSPLGLLQAERLAEALRDEAVDAVYSSDLQRAQQTAAALALGRPLEVQASVALRERHFGTFEGLTWEEIHARDPDSAVRWKRREPEFRVGGGESLVELQARCVGELTRIARLHPGAQVAIIAHGGVLDCFYRAAVGLPLAAARSWVMGNASINRLLFADGQFSLVGWNDDQHLTGLGSADDGLAAPPRPT
ncbi:histidine phosphatase family protein [Roseateles paludis]|jgi:probable phosphoglycerate mutase|uniref:Histidine phosphatase family protein n=1 Tax=Roseateles paludis TaxID=3145238 RepID=A0ABV0G6Y4_9BURK